MSSTFHLFTRFLDRPTDSILAVAAAMAIGASFKELITSVVDNFLQPLIFVIITQFVNIQKLPILNSFFSKSNGIISMTNLIVSIFSFIFIVLTVFYIVQFINTITNNYIKNVANYIKPFDEDRNKKEQ